MRDHVLADLGVGLPWGSPGDYLLLLYLGMGLFLLPALLKLLRRDRPSAWMFAAGAFLAGVSVLADSLDMRTMALATERLEQSLEEVVETLAGSLLAGSLLLYFGGRLARLARIHDRPLGPGVHQRCQAGGFGRG